MRLATVGIEIGGPVDAAVVFKDKDWSSQQAAAVD